MRVTCVVWRATCGVRLVAWRVAGGTARVVVGAGPPDLTAPHRSRGPTRCSPCSALLDKRHVFVEMGCGKGKLSLAVCTALDGARLVMVDRARNRNKVCPPPPTPATHLRPGPATHPLPPCRVCVQTWCGADVLCPSS